MWEIIDVENKQQWPRTEPCGTLERTDGQLDAQSFMTTCCLYAESKMQFKRLP